MDSSTKETDATIINEREILKGLSNLEKSNKSKVAQPSGDTNEPKSKETGQLYTNSETPPEYIEDMQTLKALTSDSVYKKIKDLQEEIDNDNQNSTNETPVKKPNIFKRFWNGVTANFPDTKNQNSTQNLDQDIQAKEQALLDFFNKNPFLQETILSALEPTDVTLDQGNNTKLADFWKNYSQQNKERENNSDTGKKVLGGAASLIIFGLYGLAAYAAAMLLIYVKNKIFDKDKQSNEELIKKGDGLLNILGIKGQRAETIRNEMIKKFNDFDKNQQLRAKIEEMKKYYSGIDSDINPIKLNPVTENNKDSPQNDPTKQNNTIATNPEKLEQNATKDSPSVATTEDSVLQNQTKQFEQNPEKEPNALTPDKGVQKDSIENIKPLSENKEEKEKQQNITEPNTVASNTVEEEKVQDQVTPNTTTQSANNPEIKADDPILPDEKDPLVDPILSDETQTLENSTKVLDTVEEEKVQDQVTPNTTTQSANNPEIKADDPILPDEKDPLIDPILSDETQTLENSTKVLDTVEEEKVQDQVTPNTTTQSELNPKIIPVTPEASDQKIALQDAGSIIKNEHETQNSSFIKENTLHLNTGKLIASKEESRYVLPEQTPLEAHQEATEQTKNNTSLSSESEIEKEAKPNIPNTSKITNYRKREGVGPYGGRTGGALKRYMEHLNNLENVKSVVGSQRNNPTQLPKKTRNNGEIVR
jgi:hypothetical protein